MMGLTVTVNVKRSVQWRKACCSLYWGFQYGLEWLNIEQVHVHGECNLHFGLFGTLLLAPTACTPGYKNRSNNDELFQKDLLSGAKAFCQKMKR